MTLNDLKWLKTWCYVIKRIIICFRNKAGCAATQVACGWAGALHHLGRSSEAKDRKNPKKVKCDVRTDGRTDGPTDGRTDGPTKRGVESRSTRLKMGGWNKDPVLTFCSNEAVHGLCEVAVVDFVMSDILKVKVFTSTFFDGKISVTIFPAFDLRVRVVFVRAHIVHLE